MNFTITNAFFEDACDISCIETRSFGDPWSEKSITEALRSELMHNFKAVDDSGRIIGYAFLSIVADEAELLNIAVDPEFRHIGIGNALIERVAEEIRANNVTSTYLEVRENNLAARSLYEKHGFSVIGIRKNYYSEPTEDAVIMKKTTEETK